MASTIIQFDLPEELLPVLAILAAAETGLVAPDAAGYIVDSGASAWQYSITVPEACVGIYRINVWDGDGITVGQGWVWIEANDTGTYIADGSFITVSLLRSNTSSARSIDDIKAKTDLIGTGAAIVSAPVSGDGDLLELILETDYLAANGRALEWSFDEITGITTAATGKFGLKDALTGTEVYVNSTGTVTDLGGGTFKVSFNITNTALDGLPPGKYDWSVEVLEGSYKITVARNRQIKTRVDIVEKQT